MVDERIDKWNRYPAEPIDAVYLVRANANDPPKALSKASVSIVDSVATWNVPQSQLPEQFAIAAYHDENGDGELNRNRLGIPTERYGFSNNARGLTGPPSFQEAMLERAKTDSPIEISIR